MDESEIKGVLSFLIKTVEGWEEVNEIRNENHRLFRERHILELKNIELEREIDILRKVAAGKVINTTGASIKIGGTRYINGSKL